MVAFDHNLYWRQGGGDIRFGSLTWEEWRKKGMDRGSQIADPRIVNPERGDFRLQPGSPAAALGFQPLGVDDAGPRRGSGAGRR